MTFSKVKFTYLGSFMNNDPKPIRRPTKRPGASKSVHIDQEYANGPGCPFSNNSSQSISPDNYTLSTLKTEIDNSENGNITTNRALQHLQYHLSLLKRIRKKFTKIQTERTLLSSRPEQISKAQIIDYNLPLKIRSGCHQSDSSSSRPSVTISSNSLHGSTSTVNLLSISRTHTAPLTSSISTASIPVLPRSPSPASIRERTRSSSSSSSTEINPSSNQVIIETSVDKINSNIGTTSDSKPDEDNQESFLRFHSDPTTGIGSVSFSSSSATILNTQAASIPRSMSASHFTRNSGSSQDGQGEKDSPNNGSNSSSTKSMTALTIWNNVNKFFVITPTIEQFQSKLQTSELPDTKVPLGPHYSIGINQKLKQKFKNGNVQLRIPPGVIAESPEGVTSIIFHRLLASFVTLDVDDLLSIKKNQYQENLNDESIEDESNSLKRLNSISSSEISNESENFNEINQPKIIDTSSLSYSKNDSFNNWNYICDYSNMEQFPVNIAGTSFYSMCPFEQKLMLEVQSLNLVPEPSGLKMTDNEVMNDILQKTKELKQITDENNQMKMEFLDTLKSREKDLLDRKEKSKKWGSVSFKVEQGQKKDLKRPKKRDKLI